MPNIPILLEFCTKGNSLILLPLWSQKMFFLQ